MPRAIRWLTTAVLVITAVVGVLYVSMVTRPPGGRGDSLVWRQVFVATFIALLAMAAALALRRSADPWRVLLLGFSSFGLLALGYLAIFSIGLPLLVAGLAALVALAGAVASSRQPAGSLRAAAGGLLALVIFFGGLEVTAEAITCPAHGFEGGSGSSFLRGPYHYTCIDGKLSIRPGECNRTGASVDASGHVIAVIDC